MPQTKTKGKGKGKGLTKKVGPVPVWALLGGIVIVLGYLYLRHRNSSSGSVAGSQNQQVIPSGVVIPPAQSTAGGTSDNSGGVSTSPVDFPTDYATQTDLQNAVDSLTNSTAAQIASITFPQPTINITPPPATVTQKTVASKTAAKKSATAVAATKPIKYYSYKKNVPLKSGQTLHFTKGKGYYAA